MAPFKPPLTASELRVLSRRNPAGSDARQLAWEVKRLRALILRAYQLRDSFVRPAGVMGSVWDDFMAQLNQEPCVREQRDRVTFVCAPANKDPDWKWRLKDDA